MIKNGIGLGGHYEHNMNIAKNVLLCYDFNQLFR